MINITTVNDIYPAVDELVIGLRASGLVRLANILNHRIHEVAWTVRAELFEELKNVLSEAMESEGKIMRGPEREQIERIIFVISEHLNEQ